MPIQSKFQTPHLLNLMMPNGVTSERILCSTTFMINFTHFTALLLGNDGKDQPICFSTCINNCSEGTYPLKLLSKSSGLR